MRTLQDLQGMDTTALIDLLAESTSKYTRMFAEKNFGDEYDEVKQSINQLIVVLESRGVTKTDMAGQQDLN